MNDNNMFLQGFSLLEDIEPQQFDKYPLNINSLRLFVSMKFVKPVTIFIGRNGCGKSTIIEALASCFDIPIVGGNKNLAAIIEHYDNGEEKQSELANYIRCSRGYKRPDYTFFFRAESFYKIADIVSNDSRRNGELSIDLTNYGNKNLLAESHGESFMDFMKHTFKPNSLYFLDEPESALSPEKQIELIALIDYYSKQGSQFIIATHSLFFIAYKDATLINLDDGMKNINYKDTEIYKTYKEFLDNPVEYIEEVKQKFFN